MFSKMYLEAVKVSHYILRKKSQYIKYLIPISRSCSLNCKPNRSRTLGSGSFLKELTAGRLPKRQRNAKNIPEHVECLILRTIGSGAPGAPKALFVKVGKQGLLFNCGEVTCRSFTEENQYKSFSQITHIFLTSPTWENVSGMSCLQEAIYKAPQLKNFKSFGPIGLVPLMNIFEKFRGVDGSRAMNYTVMRDDVYNLNDDFNVKAVSLYSSKEEDFEFRETPFVPRELREQLKKKYALAYICTCASTPGSVSIQSLIEADVPPGPHIHDLREGKTITLKDGRVIKAEQVSKGKFDGCSFIVIEIPNTDYLESLVSCSAFEPFQNGAESSVEHPLDVIVHFTPSEIMKDPRYQKWVNSFTPNVSHIVLNDKSTCFGLQKSLKLQIIMNHLLPRVFPMLQDQNICSKEDENLGEYPFTGEYQFMGPTVQPSTLFPYLMRPNLKFPKKHCTKLQIEDVLREYTDDQETKECIEEMRRQFTKLNSKQKNIPSYPNVLFLGTGSARASNRRNAASILVNLSPAHCMLMDCGEGTVFQLIRFMGLEKAQETLRQMEAVYCSHHHIDHYLGLPSLLLEREKAFKNVNEQVRPLFLLVNVVISQYLRDIHYNFYPILKDVILVNNTNIHKEGIYFDETLHHRICNSLRLNNFTLTKVRHCVNAFGITITTVDGVKITYSGDTMPSDNLVKIGMGSDLLIHEATFEEGMETDAELKRHCTLPQALQVANNMKAKFTILTHFSQKYQLMPQMDGGCFENVGFAFDNMKVSLRDLPYLPYLIPVLKIVFADAFEELRIKKLHREQDL